MLWLFIQFDHKKFTIFSCVMSKNKDFLEFLWKKSKFSQWFSNNFHKLSISLIKQNVALLMNSSDIRQWGNVRNFRKANRDKVNLVWISNKYKSTNKREVKKNIVFTLEKLFIASLHVLTCCGISFHF